MEDQPTNVTPAAPVTPSPASAPRRGNGFGITALVLGIVALVLCWTGAVGLVIGILAVIFAIVALVKRQKGFGIAGLVIGAIAILISAIVLVVQVAFVGAVVHEANKQNDAQQQADSAQKDFPAGSTATFNKFAVTVTGVTRNYTNQYTTPDAGKEYVFVKLHIKNTSGDQADVNPFDFKLDDKGVVVDPEILLGVDGSLSSTTLKPGAETDGAVAFEVNAGDTGLKLQYQTSDNAAFKAETYTLGL